MDTELIKLKTVAMFNLNTSYRYGTKIQIIKFIRLLTDLGLQDSRKIAEDILSIYGEI